MRSIGKYFVTYLSKFVLILILGLALVPVHTQAKNKTVTLFLGETKKISRKSVISYKSMTPSIATVSKDGTIHAVQKGTAKIIATTGNKDRTYQIIVKRRGLVYPEFSMMEEELFSEIWYLVQRYPFSGWQL